MKSSFKAYCKTAKYPTFSCCFLSLFGKMFFDFISFLFLIFVFHNFCRSSLLNFCADFPNQNDIIVIIIQHFYLGKTFPGDKDLSSNTDLGTMVNGCTQLSEVLGLNPVQQPIWTTGYFCKVQLGKRPFLNMASSSPKTMKKTEYSSNPWPPITPLRPKIRTLFGLDCPTLIFRDQWPIL